MTLDTPQVVTVARLDEILEEIQKAENAIEPAREALVQAEDAARPLLQDDGSLPPEEYLARRDAANRTLEAARLTLTRAQAKVEELNNEHRASLIEQCGTLRAAVANLSEKTESDMRKGIAAIIDPQVQAMTGFNPMGEDVSRLLLHSPRLRALRAHAETLTRWGRPTFGGNPHKPVNMISHMKEALALLNPTAATR